ncbi:MAG: hypothetical protein QOF78_3621, partial [Phycisphaerales bacterium]|nr:hypothetical protein [Phycisphaerales bacterium]
LRPQDLLELALVDRIVAAQWRINRCQASERLTYASMASHEQDRMLRRAEKIQKKFGFDTLEELADYCRTHPREDNIDELRAAMASFASLAAMAQLKVTPAISLAAAMTSPEDSLDHGGLQRLSAYEQRFANEQHRALRDLTRLREHAKKWADLPDSPYRQVVEIDDEEDDAEDEDATPSPRMRREGGGEGQGARGDDERSTTVASSTGASSAAARNETTDAARPSPQPSPRAGEREPEWKNEPTAENSAATEVTANSSSGASNTPPVPSKSSPVHDDVEPPSSAPPDEKGR